MQSTKEILLPVVLNGQVLTCDDVSKTHVLAYESGITVRLPDVGQEGLDAIKQGRTALLQELSALNVHDITSFLSEVGRRWLSPSYAIRTQGEANASAITGYAPRMLNLDYNFMGYVMHQRPYVYDYIESELGNERIMDEWCRKKATWVRAFPYGIVLHSMVGNMALANAFTLLWAAMTKNISLAKLPARDPVTPLALAQAFVDVDPHHPMARAVSVLYWKHDSPLVSSACNIADVVFAWGGNNAIKQLKEKVPANIPFVEFGPKWSLAVIDLDQCDAEMAAWRMAADVTFYDQEACLSPQRLFIKGERRRFIERLGHYLDKAAQHIPKQRQNRDALAHFGMNRLEASYRGWKMHTGRDWTLVEVDDPSEIVEHPLGRTLFIHPVTDIGEVAGYLNASAQTLCCEPWELGTAHRDEWGVAGVDRIVELGMSRRPQYGYTHDGMHPLSKLVRWVSQEAGVHEFYRYNDYNRETVEDRLFPWRDAPPVAAAA
ncbi:MAG: acyl-CoA reductase [Aquabacterium sp.]